MAANRRLTSRMFGLSRKTLYRYLEGAGKGCRYELKRMVSRSILSR